MGGKEGVTLQHIRNQITVGEHGPLGNTRGATGVLKHGQIISIENHRAVRRLRTGLQHRIQLERPGNGKRRHHLFDMFHEKINQGALGLWVKIRNLRDHYGLDLSPRQHCCCGLRDIGLHHHNLHTGVVELML